MPKWTKREEAYHRKLAASRDPEDFLCARFMTMAPLNTSVYFGKNKVSCEVKVIGKTKRNIVMIAVGPWKEDRVRFKIPISEAVKAAQHGVGECSEVVMRYSVPALQEIEDNHRAMMAFTGSDK